MTIRARLIGIVVDLRFARIDVVFYMKSLVIVHYLLEFEISL
jgi:hypothetical protein